jgi:hypothetical protein
MLPQCHRAGRPRFAARLRRIFARTGNNDAAAAALLDGYRPRFVDHVVFAESACRAMGLPPGAFTNAYRDNQEFLLRYFARHNPICVGITKLMRGRKVWTGYPEAEPSLYKAIRPYTANLEEGLKGSGSWLMRELPRAIGALRKVQGIVVETKLSFTSGDNNTGIRITWRGTHGTHFGDELPGAGANKAEEPDISSPEPSPMVTEMGTMGTIRRIRRLS